MTPSEISHQGLRHTESLYSLGVLTYVIGAYWVTQQLLGDWISSADLNFFLIQPVIWLGLAVVSYLGWIRLSDAPAISLEWLITAALIGVIYVGVLVLSGLVGGLVTVRPGIDWLAYIENTWYVGTLAIGLEMARTYLLHAWKPRWPNWAGPMVVILLFVVVTPYAQFQALDTVDRAIEIIGSSLIPALGISIVATWFADRGGLGVSLAFRAPILAFLWYSLVLPDLHWSTTLAVGVAAAVAAYALAGPLARALTEPEAA